MTKKIVLMLITLMLVTVLVACDSVSAVMEKMGKNVLGVDEKYVEETASGAVVTEEEKTESEKAENVEIGGTTLSTVTTISYTDASTGEKKEFISVGKKTEADGTVVQVVSRDGYILKLPGTITADIAEITSLLPPKKDSLKKITEAFDGSGKDALLEALQKPVEDETTLKAAEGTATLVLGMMEAVETTLITEDTNSEVKELVSSVVTGLKETLDPENEDKEMTMGDVVVLQAITNIISDAADEVFNLVGNMDGDGKDDGDSEEVVETDPTALLEKANDSIMETVAVLNNVTATSSAFSSIDLETVLNMVTGK